MKRPSIRIYRSWTRIITFGTGRDGDTCSTSILAILAGVDTTSPQASSCSVRPCTGLTDRRSYASSEKPNLNGIAAMSASGRYGLTKICAGIVGHANLLIGEQVAGVLESH